MTYAVEFGKTCAICLEHVTTSFEDVSATPEAVKKQLDKTTILKCGHAFHSVCIRRVFWGGADQCPECRAPVEKEDRYFEWTEDPTSSETHHMVNKKKADGNLTYVYPKNFSEEERQFAEKILKASFEKPEVKSERVLLCPERVVLYTDLSGVSHMDL